MSQILKRREITLLITLIIGLLMLADYFLISEPVQSTASEVKNWATLMLGWMLIYGGIAGLRAHSVRVYRKLSGWYWDVYVIVLILVFVIAGLMQTPSGPIPKWLHTYVLSPPLSAMYSMLAYYIIGALYRTLRVRTGEITVMTLIVFIMVAANCPLIAACFPTVTDIASWILSVPSAGACRGFLIGAAIGSIFLGIRTLMGRERGYVQ